MLVVALLISTIMEKIHQQAIIAGHRERRIKSIYAMNSELIAISSEDNVVHIAIKHISEVFEAKVVVLLPDETGHVVYPKEKESPQSVLICDLGIAQSVYEHGNTRGLDSSINPGDLIYLPLKAPSRIVGVVVLQPLNISRIAQAEKQELLANFTSQISLAIERIWIARESQIVQKKMETEHLRNSLLSAISHDLRTPLAAIVGASSILVKNGDSLNKISRQELELTIYEESLRMSGLANNLLDIARLQSGKVILNRQSKPFKEIVDDVLSELRAQMVGYPVSIKLASDLPLVKFDSVLIERVFANLLQNAVKYTPQGTPITISGIIESDELIVTVSDQGPGIPVGEEKRIFEKFFRGSNIGKQDGDGLGLTICHAIVDAHGGRIWADNLLSGGAAFHFSIPLADLTLTENSQLRTN
jgi:two-component system sensor histidine kinase KdpD